MPSSPPPRGKNLPEILQLANFGGLNEMILLSLLALGGAAAQPVANASNTSAHAQPTIRPNMVSEPIKPIK